MFATKTHRMSEGAGAWLLPGLPGKLGIATDYCMKCIKLCVCVFAHACVCTCLWRSEVSIRCLHHFLLFETGSLWTQSSLVCLGYLTSSLRDLHVSASPVLELQLCSAAPWFLAAAGDLNSGPHVYMESTLLTANYLAQIEVVFEVCLANWYVIKNKN